MELLTQEWKAMKKEMMEVRREMEELRRENQVLSNKVSGMSKDQEKAVTDLRKDNIQLLEKIDSVEGNLLKTKQKLRSERKKNKSFRRMVASLKRVWNRVLVSVHQTSQQMPALPTPPSPASDVHITLIPSPYPGCCSSPSADECSPTGVSRITIPSEKHPPKATLTKEEIKYLKHTSRFHVYMSGGHPIQPGQRLVADKYDEVYIDSVCMRMRAGVYKTPLNGRYRFGGKVWVWGEGDVDVYVCGGDGRREMVHRGMLCHGWRYNVVWDCPESLTVWVEVEGRTECDEHTRFKVAFNGGLEV